MFEATQSTPVKAVMQLIPFGIGGFLDTFLADGVRALKEEREQEFFAKLDLGKFEVNDDLARNNNFVHCFLVSYRSAMRSRHKEKIGMFAKMLNNTFDSNDNSYVDDFEDFSQILDEITLREWRALLILEEEMGKFDKEKDNREVIDVARSEIIRQLGVPADEIETFVRRLERTGLYAPGATLFGGGQLWGKVTPTFSRMKQMIEGG